MSLGPSTIGPTSRELFPQNEQFVTFRPRNPPPAPPAAPPAPPAPPPPPAPPMLPPPLGPIGVFPLPPPLPAWFAIYQIPLADKKTRPARRTGFTRHAAPASHR